MIRLENISKSFGEQHILENVSVEIKEGEKVCVIGESGIGKSVMMKLITGLLEPDEGKIWIDDQEVTSMNPVEWSNMLLQFGVVFQGAALFDSLSVLENVGIRLFEERKFSSSEIIHKVEEALELVGLDPSEVLKKYPSELSGGMQKRVGVARAIIHRPKYIFYDEPTTGLDPVNAEKIDQLIESLSRKPDTTSVIITHDLYTVKQIATRVMMIHEKKIHFNGTAEELFSSKDPFVISFLNRTHFNN